LTPLLLVAGGLAIGGAVAAFALSRGDDERPPAPVVVVSGDVSPDDGQDDGRGQDRGRGGADPSAGTTPENGKAFAEPDGGTAEGDPRTDPELAVKAKTPPPKKPRDPFTTAFARRRGKIRGCFNEHATGVKGTPQVTVTLRVNSDGRVANATLKPADLAKTPLGSCLISVARGTTFPAQSEPVEVSFPLKVRKRGG